MDMVASPTHEESVTATALILRDMKVHLSQPVWPWVKEEKVI